MATPVNFPGTNILYKGPPGRDDVGDLPVFCNGHCLVSAWELTYDEMMEVIRTGRIYVSSFSGDVLFPIFIGTETTTRGVVADYGKVWPRFDQQGDDRS